MKLPHIHIESACDALPFVFRIRGLLGRGGGYRCCLLELVGWGPACKLVGGTAVVVSKLTMKHKATWNSNAVIMKFASVLFQQSMTKEHANERKIQEQLVASHPTLFFSQHS
eukprot:471490-Amphidinium_carterae.2